MLPSLLEARAMATPARAPEALATTLQTARAPLVTTTRVQQPLLLLLLRRRQQPLPLLLPLRPALATTRPLQVARLTLCKVHSVSDRVSAFPAFHDLTCLFVALDPTVVCTNFADSGNNPCVNYKLSLCLVLNFVLQTHRWPS